MYSVSCELERVALFGHMLLSSSRRVAFKTRSLDTSALTYISNHLNTIVQVGCVACAPRRRSTYAMFEYERLMDGLWAEIMD